MSGLSVRWIRPSACLGLSIIVLFIAGLVIPPSAGAASLSLMEQNTIWGGNLETQTHYSGASDIPAAWSGSVMGIVYLDYARENDAPGYFLLLIDKTGTMVKDPIRVLDYQDEKHQYNPMPEMIWDGETFTAIVPQQGKLVLRRFLPSGELQAEAPTGMGYVQNSHLEAVWDGSKIHLFQSTGEPSAKWIQISRAGQLLGEPVTLPIGGELRAAAPTANGCAVITSRFESARFISTISLEFFDTAGKPTADKFTFEEVSMTPYQPLHWNGSTLLVAAGHPRKEGGVTLKTYAFDGSGKPAGEPRVVGEIPPGGYYGKVNFSFELVWTGTHYLAVWDQGETGTHMMEEIYAKLLDDRGAPLSNDVKINPEGLDQANHGTVFVGDSFLSLTVEQGNHNPKIIYNRLQADLNAPAFTPTPTPSPLPPTPTLAVTATPTSKPTPADQQSLRVWAYIGGISLLHIQGDALWYEHLELAKPGQEVSMNGVEKNEPTIINGREWTPVWTGKISDRYTGFTPITQPLPREEGYYYSLQVEPSEGKAVLVQTPGKDNGYEAVILLDHNRAYKDKWIKTSLLWSRTPYEEPADLPEPPYLLWKGAVSGLFINSFQIAIQDQTIRFITENYMKVYSARTVFTAPLPQRPADVSVTVRKSAIKAVVIQQPREENNYEARIAVSMDRSRNPGEIELLLTWKNTEPEPTPTPLPAWDPSAPTPTPATGEPKVLWIVQQGMLPTISEAGMQEFKQFRDIFTALGAKSDPIVIGSQPITSELLNGYAAVIFGNTINTPNAALPLTAEEQWAVVQYVRGGGSIFVIGQQDSRVLPEPSSLYAGSITKPFGIDFSVSISGTYRDFERHPLLSQVKTMNGMGGSKLLVTPPAQVLGRANSGEAILAIADVGYGRVVAYTDEAAFFSAGSGFMNEDLGGYSHKQFAQNLAAWLLHKESLIPPLPEAPTPTPTYAPAGTDADAKALLDRVLEVNEPWLNPKPIKATYELLRNGTENLGSYTVDGGGTSPLRIGSMFFTPLHILRNRQIPYQVRMLGSTVYNGNTVTVVEVNLEQPGREAIGMGGQGTTDYSSRDNRVSAFRVFLDPQKLIPLFIGTAIDPFRPEQKLYSTTWSFASDFVALNGGLAPHVVVADDPGGLSFGERQTFQVVDGVWIYQLGESWFYDESQYGSGPIQKIELINLKIEEGEDKPTGVPTWSED